jgi:hypothetical protein
MSFTYIASPYSHPEAAVREARFEAVSQFAAGLIKHGEVVFSPIAHSHPLAVKYDLAGDFDFWIHQNYGMLSKASKLLVLCLPGWEESRGVQAEIAFARQCGVWVEFTDGED